MTVCLTVVSFFNFSYADSWEDSLTYDSTHVRPTIHCMDLIKALSLISSIANIKFLLLYIFNTSRLDGRNQLLCGPQSSWFLPSSLLLWICLYKTGIYGYGYIHGHPRKICGCGYGYGWRISYPRQPWKCHHYYILDNRRLFLSSIVTLIPSGLTSRILTCTELKGHSFVLVSGYVC